MATIADIERRLAQIERELPFWRRQRGGVIAARWETEREGLLEQLAPFRFVSDPGALVLMDHAMETGWRVRMTSGEPPNTDSVMPFRLVGTRRHPGGWRWPRPWGCSPKLYDPDETDLSVAPRAWRVRRER